MLPSNDSNSGTSMEYEKSLFTNKPKGNSVLYQAIRQSCLINCVPAILKCRLSFNQINVKLLTKMRKQG